MPLENELLLQVGTRRDYALLAEHHYKARRPGTVMRVLVLRHRAPTAADRFLRRPAGPRPVAVLVESLPVLSCALRDLALGQRYAGLEAIERGPLLTAELRCISRVVVHPQWRGLGLAVRLVRAALATPATIFTEALAAMGHVHPLFERAGMTAYHRPPHAHDARLLDALESAGLPAATLARLDLAWSHITALPDDRRRFILRELDRWHRAFAGRGARRPVDPRRQLQAAQERLACTPVYYLHDNRPLPAARGH